MEYYEGSQKIVKFWNSSSSMFRITRNFVNSHVYPLVFYFVALPTSFFILYLSYSRNIGLSTFDHLLIFKYETSAILKFDRSKFWPSPDWYSGLFLTSVYALAFNYVAIIILFNCARYWKFIIIFHKKLLKNYAEILFIIFKFNTNIW